MSKYFLVLLFLAVAKLSSAQNNEYRYRRELMNVREQWHRIQLPDEIFSKVKPDLSDLRILGITSKNDTLEVPYLIGNQYPENVEQMPVKIINRATSDNRYFYTIDAGKPVRINEIELRFSESNFDWKIKLEGSSGDGVWFTILKDYRVLSFSNKDRNFNFSTLKFPESEYRYFRISLEAEKQPSLESATIIQQKKPTGTLKKYPLINFTSINEKDKKQTIITAHLKEVVPVSMIKISVKEAFDYYRPVTISALTDSVENRGKKFYTYQKLASGILEKNGSDTFKLNSSTAKDFKIQIENRDNQPLVIDSIEILGYPVELTARFGDSARYFLVYGNASANRPEYDLVFFKNKIPDSTYFLTVGEEEANHPYTAKPAGLWFKNKILLWAVMLILIIVLGFFTFRLVRKDL